MSIGPVTWRDAFRDEDLLPASATKAEKAERGRRLERIFFGMLDEAGLEPSLSYRPTGEEVDGSFVLASRTMLLELKWRKDRQPASTLYQFMGKVSGKLVGTIGLFVSMSGFSDDAVDALVVGKQINLILMDGDDVRAIVDGYVSVEAAMKIKLRAASDSGTPFVPVREFIDLKPSSAKTTVVLVEGRFDERVVQLLLRRYGSSSSAVSVVPAGGRANFAPLAESLVSAIPGPVQFVVITDGDGTPDEVSLRVRDEMAIRVSGSEADIIVMEPNLEVALGLFGADEFVAGRRKVLGLDADLLGMEIERGLGALSPEGRDALVPFEKALGLKLPSDA